MLRSLYSGISGLGAHQTMLDVTGNNIANVNTNGYKSQDVQFSDALSQVERNGGAPQAGAGGRNPAQVGLGVGVAGIDQDFTQGAMKSTGVPSNMMVSGDGFFVTSNASGTAYTRNGAFSFDAMGRLVASDGSFVQGYPAGGGPLSNVTLPTDVMAPATATTAASVTGNLPSDAEVGDELVRDVTVFGDDGAESTLSLTFTRTADGWDVEGSGGGTTSLEFTNGALTAGGALTDSGVTIDLTGITGYAKVSTVAFDSQNGSAAGSLQGYTISAGGAVVGEFSNGATVTLAQVALATFPNSGGLERIGNSQWAATGASGLPEYGQPGQAGFGSVISGALEMSNVDLSSEFTDLIVSQRGFQANSRIITTSDEILGELVNLKR